MPPSWRAASKREVLCLGRFADKADGARDGFAEADRRFVEHELARLDFRHVENIIDDREQVLAR